MFQSGDARLWLYATPASMRDGRVVAPGHVALQVTTTKPPANQHSSEAAKELTYKAYPRNIGFLLHAFRSNEFVTLSHNEMRDDLDKCSLQVNGMQGQGVGVVTWIEDWNCLRFQTTPAQRFAIGVLLEYALPRIIGFRG